MAVSVAGPLALVGTVDWAKQHSQVFGFDQSLIWLATSGGVRIGLEAGRVVPFGQVLIGVERDTLDIEQFGDDSSSHALIQPGVGVAVRLIGTAGIVGQIDWRRSLRDDGENGIRLAVGAQLKLR